MGQCSGDSDVASEGRPSCPASEAWPEAIEGAALLGGPSQAGNAPRTRRTRKRKRTNGRRRRRRGRPSVVWNPSSSGESDALGGSGWLGVGRRRETRTRARPSQSCVVGRPSFVARRAGGLHSVFRTSCHPLGILPKTKKRRRRRRKSAPKCCVESLILGRDAPARRRRLVWLRPTDVTHEKAPDRC